MGNSGLGDDLHGQADVRKLEGVLPRPQEWEGARPDAQLTRRRRMVLDRGTATGAESARQMALVVFPLADTADACYCADEFSIREVQQGVLAGAELFL